MYSIIKEDAACVVSSVDLTPLSGKNILILGSNGLIGTHLVNVLHLAMESRLISDVNVFCISKSAPNGMMGEIANNSHFEFITSDLTQTIGFPEEDFGYIVHGATYAQPKRFVRDKLSTIRLNTNVVDRVLQFYSYRQKFNFLFLSSSEIYGNPSPQYIPTPESYCGNCATTGSRAVYSESKRLGETICDAYRDMGHNVKIARMSSVYGAGMPINDKRVIGEFINQARCKGSISMADGGNNIRTFCYVSDCVTMLFEILLYGKSFIYNVGGIEKTTIRELAGMICEITQSELILSEGSGNQVIENTPDIVQLDISKYKHEFGNPGFIPLTVGLRRTIDSDPTYSPML